jgi:hypothetical protein
MKRLYLRLLALIPQPYCRWRWVRVGQSIETHVSLFGWHVATRKEQ